MRIIFNILDAVSWVIFAVTVVTASLLVLRVIVAWVGTNPFGWLPYNLRRITEPLVQPLRQPFSGYYMRFDLLPLVAAAGILFGGLFAGSLYSRFVLLLDDVVSTAYYGVVTLRHMLVWLIVLAATLLELAIFLRIILPWFGVGYGSRIFRLAFRVTEPLLRPIRRLLGRYLVISMFDFSAFLALLVIRIVTGFVVDLVR